MAMKASNSRTGWLRLAEWDKISQVGREPTLWVSLQHAAAS